MEKALKAIFVTCPLQTSGLRHPKCSCLKQTCTSTNLFLILLPLHFLSSQKLPSQLISVTEAGWFCEKVSYCFNKSCLLICAENMHIPITNLKYPVNNCLSSCINELTQNHSVSIKQIPYCQYKPSRESTACSKHDHRTTYAKPRKTNTLQTYQISLLL